jgi:hypothetical protein
MQVFGNGATPIGVQGEAVSDVTHRGVSVAPGGTATLEVDLDPVSASTNGRETPIGSNPEPWRIVVDPLGAILDSSRPVALEAPPEQAAQGPIVHVNPSGAINPFPFLTSEPVAVGTGWSGRGRVPSPFGGDAVPFTVAGRLLGYGVLGGAAAAVVESRVTVDLDVTVPAAEYLEGSAQSGFDVPADAALDYDGELRYVQRAWLEPKDGRILRSEITAAFATDAAWLGVPSDLDGFDPIHAEGRLEAHTERTG